MTRLSHTELILEAAAELETLPSDLQSAEKEYLIFRRLEDLEVQDDETCNRILASPEVAQVRCLLSKRYLDCVYRMEILWAQRLLETRFSYQDLYHYPKYSAYILRTRVELSLARVWLNRDVERVVVAGSGALPLTAIASACEHQCDVFAFDRSGEAIDLAQQLVTRLCLDRRITCAVADATHPPQFLEYDAILVSQSVTAGDATTLTQLANAVDKDGVLVLKPPHLMEHLLLPPLDLEPIRTWQAMRALVETKDDFLLRIIVKPD